MRSLSALLRVASSARESAARILESDLDQLALILTTLVASTVYAWVEGFAVETPRYEATQVRWILGLFSTYSLAMAFLFACITGFGLLKARSMFSRKNTSCCRDEGTKDSQPTGERGLQRRQRPGLTNGWLHLIYNLSSQEIGNPCN
jgi:hypothetical protein